MNLPASAPRVRVRRRLGRIPASALAAHEATLLAVARDLFYRGGFEGTSIEAIARAARVSPKTIYTRFGGKPGLFMAAMKHRADEVLRLLQEPIARDLDMRAALVEFAERLLSMTASEEALTIQRIVFSEAHRFPELGRAFYAAGPERGIAALADFLERAHSAKLLAVEDAAAAAELFAGSLLGVPLRAALALGHVFRGDETRARAEYTVDAFLRAFKTGV